MERRDEEVARALQREEHERAADIERKDEQLAHLIAVQERRQEALRRRRRQEQTIAAADEARRRREADDAEYARTLQEQFDAEKKGDAEVKRMMELMEEEEASMSLIRQLLGHEKQFRGHHHAEDLMKHSDDQLCEALFAGNINEFLTEDTRQVTDIKRVLQVELVRRFMAKWLELKRTYGSYAEEARPRLGFHGTPEANIPNILQQGLLVPGTHGVINRTDDGYYGAGIYLSPDARTSLGYAGGCGKLLVCAVLMGRIYKCEDLMHGAPCTPGFDSHMSPCEGELILFEAAQVLPCFVITIASAVHRPMPTSAPPYQSTAHLTAKKAAKAKGGRTPKATAKLKRQRKLARRAQRAAKGGRKNK
ncbi:Poly(ADPribose) polymerase catalytic domain containing protein [Acanthamoeba castellanii str. Neff]|uniref:Poly(ADPribose) polymerase catalytic domain containing protein n=1 Tax=Acanthamoeba castellanii (strain ATCC 30010 / Neff) TaxID=1257118 RepID=L8H9V5_ACACF|nr:Poly(ADPribose) polymerase catalytic domain containing protein [Acanthamoeba castellanii str. Neff]ELR21503.1 Poly(ADPribose) polymerase catalytic domain containing protein [Acanthamoeba castellanii str. Neff]